MSTGELVGVFNESFLLHVHQDPLAAHSADVVGQVPAGHAAFVVVLEGHINGGWCCSLKRSLFVFVHIIIELNQRNDG